LNSKYPLRKAGHQFGEWRVIEPIRKRKGELYYTCECLGCNTRKDVSRGNLEQGKTKSCVICANKRILQEKGSVYLRFAHIERPVVDRLANRYYAVLSRCRGVGYSAHRYGGRGIQCEFADVYDFVGYVLTLEGWDNPKLQVDRIENNGNYVKGNLRFTTSKNNNRNKEVLRYITWDGRTMPAVEFWEKYCPQYRTSHTVCRKIREGLSPEQIIADQIRCRGAYKKLDFLRLPVIRLTD